jgi:hypothetical protein
MCDPPAMPWDALMRRFKSNSAAASRLHADWKRRSPRAAREVSAGSLATKLGDLRRGKRLWWEKRPELTELLAELLECEVSELLGPAAAPVGLEFPEFPGLRPLAPNESPCRLWSEGWLCDLAVAPLGRQRHGRWIHAPPGMGKSLAIRWLVAHAEPGSVAVSLHRLVEVAAHRNVMAPLFVEVDERDPIGDEEALRTLAIRRAPTVVLAPFELPEPRLGGRPRLFQVDGWERHKPRFTHTERERLMQWIDARLETSEGDTRMVADDVRAWLDHHDPHTQLVATPADLLALCFDFHVHGRDAITLGRRARRWLAGVTAARSDGDARIRTPVERTFIALCAAELTDRSLARGHLQAEDWEAHVPATVQRGEGPRSGAAVLVEHLREAGLLRGGAHGLDLAPTWVAYGLSGEAARPLLESDDAARWGLLAADATRRAVVDHILDQLSTAALLALVRAVVKGPATACPLGWLGAREATFAAAARRLEQPGFVLPDREHATWQRLAVLVIANLKVVQERRNVPHTRLDVDLWWSLTWLFSLRVPPPASLPEPGLGWYFPGWTQRLDFAELPRSWPWSNKVPDDPQLEVARMVALASEVVARFPDPPPDVDWPRVLLPALLLVAPARGWCLPPKVVSMLSGSWEERVFLHQAAQLPDAQRAAIAGLLWELAPRVHAPPNEVIPVTMRLARMKNTARGLLPFILENLPSEVLERTIETDGLCRSDVELDDLQLLPRRLRRSVVGTALAQPTPDTSRWSMARDLAPLLDVEDLDLIVDLVQQSEANTAAEFVGFVWTVAPDRGRREATAAFQTRHPAASAWFHFAPRSELAPLLDLVDVADAPLPEWLQAWARARVPFGGLMAERLHALARERGAG